MVQERVCVCVAVVVVGGWGGMNLVCTTLAYTHQFIPYNKNGCSLIPFENHKQTKAKSEYCPATSKKLIMSLLAVVKSITKQSHDTLL